MASESERERDKIAASSTRVSLFLFLDSFIEPSEKELEHNPDKILAGRFTGLLNSLFSGGIGAEYDSPKGSPEQKKAAGAKRTDERWRNTVKCLAKVADEEGLDVDGFDGSLANFLAGVAVAALQSESKTLLAKTRQRKYTKDGEQKLAPTDAGTIEDYTQANAKKRGVVWFPDPSGAEEIGGAGPADTGAGTF